MPSRGGMFDPTGRPCQPVGRVNRSAVSTGRACQPVGRVNRNDPIIFKREFSTMRGGSALSGYEAKGGSLKQRSFEGSVK